MLPIVQVRHVVAQLLERKTMWPSSRWKFDFRWISFINYGVLFRFCTCDLLEIWAFLSEIWSLSLVGIVVFILKRDLWFSNIAISYLQERIRINIYFSVFFLKNLIQYFKKRRWQFHRHPCFHSNGRIN